MPPQAGQKPTSLGLERNVGAQLNHPRTIVNARGHVREILYPRGPESGRINKISRIPPVRMVKCIQQLGLQRKANLFSNWNDFRKRHIIIPKMRPIQPRVKSERSRSRVLAYALKDRVASTCATAKHRRIDHVLEWARCVENPDRVLQLRDSDAAQG